MFVYELSGCGFESSWSHLNFRFRACFEQRVLWHSGNYWVWIHSETRPWHDKNIQSVQSHVQLRIWRVFLTPPSPTFPEDTFGSLFFWRWFKIYGKIWESITIFQMLFIHYFVCFSVFVARSTHALPEGTGRKLNVLCTFNLRPVSTWLVLSWLYLVLQLIKIKFWHQSERLQIKQSNHKETLFPLIDNFLLELKVQ